MKAAPQPLKYVTRLVRFDYKESKFGWATYQMKQEKNVQSEFGGC